MNNLKFSFCFTEQVLDEVNKLNLKRSSQTTDIPVPIIKDNKDIIALFIYHNFNNSLSSSSFPTDLKYADLRPAFKKDNITDKEKYRSISILPNISKVYERLKYDQLYPYFNEIFPKLQRGFRKSYNLKQCLIFD